MAKLNFYDTDAVKAFVLDILIENAELKSDLDYEKKCAKEAFTKFVAILNTGSVENVENISEPEATNAGKAQIGFMAGNGGNENE